MRPDKLKAALHEFARTLAAEAGDTERPEYRHTYAKAAAMVEELISSDRLSRAKFERIHWFVSDSLPWTEAILKSWDKVARLYQEMNGDAAP